MRKLHSPIPLITSLIGRYYLAKGTKTYTMKTSQGQQRISDFIIGFDGHGLKTGGKKNCAPDLIKADKEMLFQNEEKERHAAALIIANKELAYQNSEKEKRARELIAANKALEQAQYNTMLALEEAGRANSKYRNLIENSGVVMYSASLAGNITFANRKAYELTGYPVAELMGKSLFSITDPECMHAVKGKYIAQLKNDIKETICEFCIRTKNGELKWVEQSAVLITEAGIPVGFQCIIKDISQKKEMEEVLRISEQRSEENQMRLQSILDNTGSLIYIKDLYGKYLIVNKEFKKALQVNDAGVIGKTDFDFTDTERATRYKKSDDEVIRNCTSVELETELVLQGEKRNFLITKFPLLDADNNLYGISGIATDITERVKYREQLIIAREEAENSRNLQEHFLANMSHEIRTPMKVYRE